MDVYAVITAVTGTKKSMLIRIYILSISTLLITGCATQVLKPEGHWQLQQVQFAQQPPAAVQGNYSIVFNDDGASGMLACNRWHGQIEFSGDNLKLLQPTTTRKACKTSLQADLATEYLHALQRGGKWQNNTEHASFINKDGTRWDFIRH